MSKMLCVCGVALSDVLYPCPTEGRLFGEQSEEAWRSELATRLASFFDAVHRGSRCQWLEEHLGPEYPQDLADALVIADIVDLSQRRYGLAVAECEGCGRLHVEVAVDKNEFRSFTPDEPGYHRVLARATPGRQSGTRSDVSQESDDSRCTVDNEHGAPLDDDKP